MHRNSESSVRMTVQKNIIKLDGRAKPDVRPPGAAILSAKSIEVVQILPAAMAVGLLRSVDWPGACHIGRSAALPVNHRCAVGLLPLPRDEFRQLKLILQAELRRRAASRRDLPCPSSFFYYSLSIVHKVQLKFKKCKSI